MFPLIQVVTCCAFGRERVYTTRKVTDHHSYVSKCDFFNTTYTSTLQPMANYYPGFKFLELPGASLNVIGVLNTHATPQEAEQVKSSDTRFALEFYRNILMKVWQLRAKPEATTQLQLSDIRILYQFIFEFIKTTFQHFPEALKHSFKHLTTTQPTATSLCISNSGK